MPNKTLRTVFAIALCCSTPFAQASWWEQAVDLLKGSNTTEQTNTAGSTSAITTQDMNSAFKQALSLGSEAVVKQLGAEDGFNADSHIHIPLPQNLQTVKDVLSKFGMQNLMDDVELKLNRAAEAAAPQAKSLFLNAIQNMTFEDVQKIYQGPQDSATQYLKSKTSDDLKAKMQPIIEETLNSVGAVSAYDKAIANYKNLPFVPDVKADLQNHVTQKSLDGLFYYLAQQEQAIRKDPAKQTTELLKRVFGSTQ
ncbi:DUF4197 domain-containing protein [Thiomicrorhabdus cannonii]|uniref:DUF4197 domain-containing protein n=1 Tax=Thiomicrorhabdus cannonii TaxID=2748011 RepID=UPI0015C09171|nr:DUF4197 domain-containing protein [Thiomicrorhabdus cannonii]